MRLAHPDVLSGAGLKHGWSGLALGMGLDRLLMLVKGIDDIRVLRSNDDARDPRRLGTPVGDPGSEAVTPVGGTGHPVPPTGAHRDSIRER